MVCKQNLPAFHNKQENNEIKNHLAVLFVRVPCPSNTDVLFAKLLHSFHPNRS